MNDVRRWAPFGRRIAALAVVGAAMALLPTAASAATWQGTDHISQGQTGGNGSLNAALTGASEDGSRVFVSTSEQLAATDTDAAQDIYMREGATTTHISQGQINGNGPNSVTFARASQNGSRVFFVTVEQLAATDTDGAPDVYMREGATTTQISQGQINGNGALLTTFASASQDGSRVFFSTNEQLAATDTDAAQDLYMREGATTTQISQGQINGNGAAAASFGGASQDGSRVFFLTGEQLAATDTDASTDLYMREGATTTQISQGQINGNGAFSASFLGASQNGSRVFFFTGEQLAATDTDSQPDIYMREGSTTTQITQGQIGGNGAFGPGFSGASQDGSRVFFPTSEQLAATDTDAAQDLYMREGATTTQISQGQINGNGAVAASFGGASQNGSRVFFVTNEQLAATDTDSVSDLYMREGSTTTQITQGQIGGNGAFGAGFAGASQDGSRVFFFTAEQLAATDTDAVHDIYVREGATTTQVTQGAVNGNGAIPISLVLSASSNADGSRFLFLTSEQLALSDTDVQTDVYQARIGSAPPASPTLSTSASANVTLGGQVSDTATLEGGQNPTGQITFKLFGPDDANCTGAAVFTDTKPVSGNGNYNSASFTPTTAGTYRWVADYSGDAGNSAVTGACNGAGENVVVAKKTPTLQTNASPDVTVGGQVSDTATLAAGHNATGQITFNLYGPNDAGCSGTAVFTAIVSVSGNADYNSTNHTPAQAGAYRWTADYSGDANNNPVSSACNAPGESVTVAKKTPTISTQASADTTIGGQISDTATIAAGFNPTGTVTFKAYGPDDANCSGAAAFTDTKPVSGNGNYPSANFTPTAVGTYRWIATYSGDANNHTAAGACNDAGESVLVAKKTPTLATTASADVEIGGQISDTATLASGQAPSGQITFIAYGPDDANCSGTAAFTDTKPVSGNGGYPSASFTPTQTGTYRWIATYSGDANNHAAAGSCNDAGESALVSKPKPGLSTLASADVSVGGQISDTATISGGLSPGGTITFRAYGPDDANCSGAAAFTDTKPVTGNGSYTSASFTPGSAGTYRWIASYSGDGQNGAVAGNCNDTGESVVVSAQTPTLQTQASADVTLGGQLSDTATIAGGAAPTGDITFNLYGPNDTNCAGAVAFTDTVTVNGNGSYPSANFTPTSPGTYRWTADYTGDINNVATSSPCNSPGESVTVSKATPTLEHERLGRCRDRRPDLRTRRRFPSARVPAARSPSPPTAPTTPTARARWRSPTPSRSPPTATTPPPTSPRPRPAPTAGSRPTQATPTTTRSRAPATTPASRS